MYTKLILLFCLFTTAFVNAHSHHGIRIENVNKVDSGDVIIYEFDVTNTEYHKVSEVDIVLLYKSIEPLDEVLIKEIQPLETVRTQLRANRDAFYDKELDIHVRSLYGKLVDDHSQSKQVNTLNSEFYADAPWRMKKYDDLGNLQSIPVHCFLHDAHLFPGVLKVDNIDIQLKSASSTTFDPPLTFDLWSQNDFESLFSCISEDDSDMDIKGFDMGAMSQSASTTIDFNDDFDLVSYYEGVNEEYWYFTFNIPSSLLVGYDDVIDIRVTIEYANITTTDDHIGLRVFRETEDLPSQAGWYRGDTHLHSMYTQNDAEIGLPLCATKAAAKLLGVDWITTTDHTSDYDNYGAGIQQNWQRIKSEAAYLNNQDSSLVYITGLELAVNNSNDKLVHMLAYPNPNSPFTMPFVGDGHGDLTATTVNIPGATNGIDSYNGFAYMAHPFATGDELPTIPTNGGIWNVAEASFPMNNSTYPIDGGVVICNDLNSDSDVLSDDPNVFVRKTIKGGQIWNSRNTITSTGDENDPWDVDNSGGVFSQMDTTSVEFHMRRFRQGQEIINHINRVGLQLKNSNPSIENWKLFYAAGTDAHGSFNYSNTNDFGGFGVISNNAVGKMSTVTYCPNGMGSEGKSVLTALHNGNTTMSDGPLLTFGLSTNGDDNTDEVILGDDALVHSLGLNNYHLNIDYTTTPEFGDVVYLQLIVGTEQGEQRWNVPLSNTSGDNTINYSLESVLNAVLGSGNAPQDEYFYIRAELRTDKDYTGQENLYYASRDVFHSITNPIWLKVADLTAIDEISRIHVNIYPNPTDGSLTVDFGNEGNYMLTITDQFGRMVKTENVQNSKWVFDASELSSGIYFINVTDGSGMSHNRFVKK
jgi:hypothetical protein